jgi:hypothetical protein
LRGGRMKRQDLADGLANLVIGLEGDPSPFAHTTAFKFEAQFEEKQFFENQAAVRRRGPGLQLCKRCSFRGEVHFTERGFAIRHVEPGDHG